MQQLGRRLAEAAPKGDAGRRVIALDATTVAAAQHGLRHGAATLALTAGADLKVMQDQLCHSTVTLVADTYTLLPARQHAASRPRVGPEAAAPSLGTTNLPYLSS